MAVRRLVSPILTAAAWGLATAHVVVTAAGAAPTGPQREVLVLYATSRDSRIAVIGERELPRLIGAGLNGALDYYSEFIDRARFDEPAYQNAVRDFLLVKYKERRFDVIISMNDVSTEFIVKYRDELFPGTPIVFFSEDENPVRPPNATGIVGGLDFSASAELAMALQPNLQRLYVVTGSSPSDKDYEREARAQFASLAPRLDVRYLSGLRTSELLHAVATLPERSAIYYVIVYRDATGENFNPLQYLDRVAAAANAPIYSWTDSTIDHGIVGGALKNQARETELLARLALRIVKGEPADAIALTTADLTIRQVDWRQLARWNIPDARVPLGTIVRFKLPTLWDRYAEYILAASALFVAQTILIAALLVQRARRRGAEAQLRAHDAELRASYDRIRDLGGRLLTAQESERSRIARELHDDVSQQLALLEMDLESLANSSPDDDLDVGEPLNRTRELARTVHDLSHRLHPARLRLVGLVPALEGLCQELSRPDVAITLMHRDVPRSLSPELTLCLFRVVQEAVQNALKYSHASAISIHLQCGRDQLELTVADDGRGFDVRQAWGTGLGLVSIEERLDAFHGKLEIESTPGQGTRLHGTVPSAALSHAGGVMS